VGQPAGKPGVAQLWSGAGVRTRRVETEHTDEDATKRHKKAQKLRFTIGRQGRTARSGILNFELLNF